VGAERAAAILAAQKGQGGHIPPAIAAAYQRLWFCRTMGWTFAEYEAADYWAVLQACDLLPLLPAPGG